MEVSEPTIERKPKSLVIRMFGIVAFMFGVPYLVQGVAILNIFFFRQYSPLMFNLVVATIAFDLVLGIAAILVGIGLFFHKEWARQTWLVFLPLLLFVHLHMTVLQLLAGQSRMDFLYKWIALVIAISILSWAYLSKARTKSRFH